MFSPVRKPRGEGEGGEASGRCCLSLSTLTAPCEHVTISVISVAIAGFDEKKGIRFGSEGREKKIRFGEKPILLIDAGPRAVANRCLATLGSAC